MPFTEPNRPLWAALVSATLLAGVEWYTVCQSRDADRLVVHTIDVRRQFTLAERDHIRAKALQRGFLITGRKEYLDGYDLSVAAAKERVDQLVEMTADNHDQLRRIKKVKDAMADALVEMNETIEQVKAGMKPQAYQIVDSDRGFLAHRRIAAAVDECVQEEDKLLLERTHRADTLSDIAYLVTALFGISAGVTVTLFYLRARRYGPQRG